MRSAPENSGLAARCRYSWGASIKGNLCMFRLCGGALVARRAPPLFGALFWDGLWDSSKPVNRLV
jgi:hypothetical protein